MWSLYEKDIVLSYDIEKIYLCNFMSDMMNMIVACKFVINPHSQILN